MVGMHVLFGRYVAVSTSRWSVIAARFIATNTGEDRS